MADFSTGVNSPAPGPSAIPAAGGNPALSNTVSILSGALTGLGGAINTAIQNDAAQKAKNIKNNTLANVQQNILKIADAQDQGILTQDQARSRARILQAQAIANDPSLREDINKVFDSTLSTTGLAASIREGTQSEQDNHALEMKAFTDAQSEGYILPWMSDTEKEQGLINFQKVKQAQARLKAANDELAFKTAQVGLTNAKLTTIKSQLQITGEQLSNAGKATSNQIGKINLAKAQHEQEVIGSAQKLLTAGSDNFETQARYIANQVDSGKLDRAAGQLALSEINRRMHLAIDPTMASGGAAEAMGKLASDLIDKRTTIWSDYVSGKTQKEQLQTDINRQDLIEQQIALNGNTKFKRDLALQHLVGVSITSLDEALFSDTVSHIINNSPVDSNGNPKPNPTESPANLTGSGGMDPAATKQYLKMTEAALAKVNSGRGTPEDMADIDTHFRNILAGVGTFGPTVKNPAKLDSLVTFMAGPEFGGYAVKHPDTFTSSESAGVNDALERFYTSKVIPLIRGEFIKDNIVVGMKPDTTTSGAGKGLLVPDARGTAGTISVEYNKNQVRFTPNDNYKNNPAVQKRAAQLNNEVGPVINKIIKVEAHTDGSMNYSDYFPRVIDRILPSEDRVVNVAPVRGGE